MNDRKVLGTAFRSVLAGAIALLPTSLLSACSDDAPPPERRNIAQEAPPDVPAWVYLGDHVDLGWWLASRRAFQPAAKDSAMAAAYDLYLRQASKLFVEDQRMIANRTVQTSSTLSEQGIEENYDAILDKFTELAEFSGRKLLYGELCQHYVNLRMAGKNSDEALAELRSRYQHAP
ncbi:conserved hypothetical protein [Methylocella silvestris BL2]|uniref:MxaH protein n=1 Tax=Methylocella silvestris (strain DSM 15510 / CIP 108128 / LMG 27833 / NCIMB 13906 / BL2) TaxID=395965 RepID=B8EJQ2_METSB|nr:hypothetical protein [Methylocella silvestris]ACK49456.1 conserved hypothetical protein [Methylocella silvestris BL2]